MSGLPPGWASSTIGDIADYVQRGRGPTYAPRSTFPVINQKCIRWDGVDPAHLKFIDESTRSQWVPERHLKRGDVLWNSTGTGTLGRAAVFEGLPGFESVVVDSHVTIVRSTKVEPRFIYYWIRSPAVQGRLEEMQAGSTNQVELPRGEVIATKLPLAPINEQRRIVAKLDSMFEQTRSAKARLERLPALLDKLKRSILAAAFRGDLTADWRVAHPEVEPASALLDRIRAERRSQWEAALRAKGKDPSNAKYEEPRGADGGDELPQLPAGWSRARAEEMCEFITKGTTPAATKMNTEGGVPFIKVYNLTFDGSLDFSIDPTFVDPAVHHGELARSRVFPGDVLMNIVGPPLGKVSVVPNDHPEWNINQAIAVFRPLAGMHREYLRSLLIYLGADRRTLSQAKATSGQLNLTLEICRNLVFPLPPEDEQRELAKRLDTALRTVDALTQVADSVVGSIDELGRAVLAKAFRGELVEQDPTDEPASTLLARLRTQTASEGSKDKPTRGKPRRTSAKATKADADMLSRKDVSKNHLTTILKERGALSPEALWKSSQLEIDDFYDQLKDEESRGLLRENRGDPANASRLLEPTA